MKQFELSVWVYNDDQSILFYEKIRAESMVEMCSRLLLVNAQIEEKLAEVKIKPKYDDDIPF